ncbi:sporulation protein Cse60 [Cohnella caldifontis]|uniref:sporulation protein Cse60 n=1 Tax=Cohnella caldifontis TaxID=3027471 RepID=UPI0023EDF630|nr:sporulation protein Cse60 [Cohnella sp. YIM B05605]
MIQVKEFVDSDTVPAERSANEFLATLRDDQVIDIRYGTFVKKHLSRSEQQRSCILIIYRTGPRKERSGSANEEGRS